MNIIIFCYKNNYILDILINYNLSKFYIIAHFISFHVIIFYIIQHFFSYIDYTKSNVKIVVNNDLKIGTLRN
jgi:hypothetical protein